MSIETDMIHGRLPASYASGRELPPRAPMPGSFDAAAWKSQHNVDKDMRALENATCASVPPERAPSLDATKSGTRLG